MRTEKKTICFINGSLRGKKSSSLSFLNDVSGLLDSTEYKHRFISMKPSLAVSYSEETMKALSLAHAIILAFPLHAYCLPGALMKLFEDFYQYTLKGNYYNKDARIYVIVNCAFPEPKINREAVRVVKNFCRKFDFNWRFAVSIGGGLIVKMTKNIPVVNRKLKKSYARMVNDIRDSIEGETKDILIKPIIPKFVMLYIKESKWAKKYMARKNDFQ